MAQNLKINITAQDRTKQAFKGIRGGLASLKNAVFSLRGAFVGLGAGLVIKSFVDTIKKSKPSGAKGTFIKKISLSSTMGVSVNCEIN